MASGLVELNRDALFGEQLRVLYLVLLARLDHNGVEVVHIQKLLKRENLSVLIRAVGLEAFLVLVDRLRYADHIEIILVLVYARPRGGGVVMSRAYLGYSYRFHYSFSQLNCVIGNDFSFASLA